VQVRDTVVAAIFAFSRLVLGYRLVYAAAQV